jgi:hypothetical protein
VSVTDTEAPIPTSHLDGAVEEYPRDKLYILTALFLGAVTAIEVCTYLFPHFAGWSTTHGTSLVTAVLILCMAVKFFTVAYIFMHLKFDKRVLTIVFYFGLTTAVLVYLAVLTMLNVWYPGHPHP